MRIILAGPRGFCAGVNMAIESLERPWSGSGCRSTSTTRSSTTNGWSSGFQRRGVVFVDDLAQVPAGRPPALLGPRGLAGGPPQARQRKLRTIDATCPLVTKVHREAIAYARKGYTIMLIGHDGHDEVVGTMGEVARRRRIVLVQKPRRRGPAGGRHADKLAYLTQTTLSVDDAAEIIARLRQRFPQIVGPAKDDICYATQNRQEAVRELSAEADVVLVVGSHNSSNSLRLAELAAASGVRTHLIDGAGDIDLAWFSGDETVLITAGASAPETVVQDCVRVLCERFQAVIENRSLREESVRFLLPKELRAASHDSQRPGVLPGRDRSARRAVAGAVGGGAAGDRPGPGRLGRGRSRLAGRASWPPGATPCCRCWPAGACSRSKTCWDWKPCASPLRAALEMASWDLVGRIARQPLHRLCGGAYRLRIPLSVRLYGKSSSQVVQMARELSERGFHSQIITSSGEWSRDVETVAEVREAVGRRVELRLDAASRLRPADRPRPVPGGGGRLAEVRAGPAAEQCAGRDCRAAAADERSFGGPPGDRASPADVLALLRCGAAESEVVDLQLVGGTDAGAEVRGDRPGRRGSMPRWAAALPGNPRGGDAAARRRHAGLLQLQRVAACSCRSDLFSEPLEIVNGMIAVPQGPGLGVEIDRGKIERYQVA